jgi:hypothetical protein
LSWKTEFDYLRWSGNSSKNEGVKTQKLETKFMLFFTLSSYSGSKLQMSTMKYLEFMLIEYSSCILPLIKRYSKVNLQLT